MNRAAESPNAPWALRARARSLVIAAPLAAVLLYYSFRGIDWEHAARLVAGASFPRLLLTTGIATLTLFLRAARWRILLNAQGHVAVPTAFWATAAGYFGNNFLP